MKIATFNANSIRARLSAVIRWLEEHQPDVLCLQETKGQDAEFPVGRVLGITWDER
jgi:exodeoxyribonuclease-3